MNILQPLRPKPPGNPQHPPFIETRSLQLGTGRRNISRACGSCREKKTKCDGREPACSNCVNLNKTCSYKRADGRKKEKWISIIQDLQLQNKRLEEVIASLGCNQFPEAVESLKIIRSSKAVGGDSQSYWQSSTTSSSKAVSIPPAWLSEVQRNDDDTPSFDAIYDALPQQPVTHHCMSAYFSCGSTLFYIISREICDDIASRFYGRRADMDMTEVCVLCAVAAVGSEYSTADIPYLDKMKYFEYASWLLKYTSEKDSLMAMRVSAALALCLILRKSASARTITASGLNIGRWNMRKQLRNASSECRLEWARVLRTLAFIECWLSFTLDYTFDLGQENMGLLEELASSESSANPFGIPSHSIIQAHVCKAALLSARVQSQLQHTTSLSGSELDQLMGNLDSWHEELPKLLSLPSVDFANIPISTGLKRPLLFMHMVHIGSRIIMHERTILANQPAWMAIPSNPSTTPQVFQLPKEIRHAYASSAQQLSRIIGVLYKNQCVLSRCWLTIHSCYHASLALLLLVARSLILGVDRSSVSENLSYVHDCVLALRCCNEKDIAAMRVTEIIVPFYENLRRIAGVPPAADQTSSMSSEADGDDETMIPVKQPDSVVSKLLAAMEAPSQDLWI